MKPTADHLMELGAADNTRDAAKQGQNGRVQV
jgi:hypothetical protein